MNTEFAYSEDGNIMLHGFKNNHTEICTRSAEFRIDSVTVKPPEHKNLEIYFNYLWVGC